MEPIYATCICKKDYYCPSENDLPELNFKAGFEYQVDVFDLFYQVYLNGGWRDYTFLNIETFNEHFNLI